MTDILEPITELNPSMNDIENDVTELTIYHINSTPELNNMLSGLSSTELQDNCIEWAKRNNNEFGELFETELYMVKWDEVAKRV